MSCLQQMATFNFKKYPQVTTTSILKNTLAFRRQAEQTYQKQLSEQGKGLVSSRSVATILTSVLAREGMMIAPQHDVIIGHLLGSL